jgi:hypothetical protein
MDALSVDVWQETQPSLFSATASFDCFQSGVAVSCAARA